ncbi:DUF5134 domain-containing protein [Nocardioides sp. GY 10127]|uniref:DUF5134 domain-containing protein n=1 Tax=Nocardioides sp. GY 10127 TaxID=2569762 RepID=UPI0010A7F723|nr:DUF5134 domain-containing protein [Nocardioides sp. GY 10127]TIC82671.1 DUF5134 domain-containing protein [Nocardioides sp. GY 10127]
MQDLLLVAVALASVVCLARAVVPAWRVPGEPRGADYGHLVMSAGMAAMLLLDLPTAVLAVLVAGYALGSLGCLVRVVRPLGRAAYLRLAGAFAGMSGMLALMLTMPAQAAEASSAHAMAGMDMSTGMSTGSASGSGLLREALGTTGALLLLVVAGAALWLFVRSRGEARACRAGLAGESVMAGAMAVMLLQMG